MPIGISPELQNQAALQYYKDEFGTDVAFVQRVVRHADSLLTSLGITDAQISLLSKHGSEAAFGATRLPILITLSTGEKYVLKKYDVVNSEVEQQVLKKIEGICGSKILVFAQQFFVEEYIDPEKFTSLEVVAQLGYQTTALERLGEVQAILASLEIIDTNTHLMDEVYLNSQGEIRITDVGHVQFLLEEHTPEVLEKMNQYNEFWATSPTTAALEYFKSILIFRDRNITTSLNSTALEEIARDLQQFADLVGTGRFVQLAVQLRSLLFAVKYFYQERRILYPWKKASEDFPTVLHAYCNRYTAQMQGEVATSSLAVDKQAMMREKTNMFLSMPSVVSQRKAWLEALTASDTLKFTRAGDKVFAIISLNGQTLFSFSASFVVDKKLHFELDASAAEKLQSWLVEEKVADPSEFTHNFIASVDEYSSALYFSK